MSTIIDIAKKTGVSTATVSRVLNQKGGKISISEATKKKVLQAVEELNYTPNMMARSLVQKKSFTLGFVLPEMNSSFFPEVTVGLEREANAHGLQLFVTHSAGDLKTEEKVIQLLLNRIVDGLVIVPADMDKNMELFVKLKKNKTPFVIIDQYCKTEEFNTVKTNDEEAAYQAVSYLINQGHRRIGHIAGASSLPTSMDRLEGYKRALKEHNIKLDNSIVKNSGGKISELNGFETMKYFIGLKNPPTAVFAVTDIEAFGAFKAVKEKGMKIPDDFSLMGFSDVQAASLIDLTTVCQPKVELGRTACQRLLELIDQPALPPKTIVLDSKLVCRTSTRRI